MLKQTVVLTLLAASVVVASACRGTETTATATGPSADLAGGGALVRDTTIGVTPTSLVAQLSGRSPCPRFQPFQAFTNVTIRTGDTSGFTLTSIDMRFFDRSGLSGPTVTLPAPVPTRQFGTELIHARSVRSFPLEFGFGCGTSRFGTIVIVVNGRDDNGRRRSEELRATVQ
jgi:hypothetical protein